MIPGLLYVVGALLVLAAAFLPLSFRVYGHPPAEQVAAVQNAPRQWRWHHLLFGAGATTTATAAIWEAIGSGRAATVAAAVAFTLGAAFFVHFLQTRAAMPPTVWFRAEAGRRRFAAFTGLTALGLGLRGIGLVQAGSAGGVFLAGYAALLLGLFVVLRDMPPFTHYVGSGGLGVGLIA